MSSTTLLIAFLSFFSAGPQGSASKPAVSTPFFGNETCPISAKPIDRTKLVELDGQPVFLCCGMCAAKANADAKGTAAKAYPKATNVPNKLCPVMGEPNDESKSVVTIAGKTVHLCCDDCGVDAKKAWAATLAKATDEKLADQKNAKCVCGKDAAGAWVAVADGKIYRLCSAACVDEVKKDPKKLASVAPAKKG
jgi:YHS domain-containing protein